MKITFHSKLHVMFIAIGVVLLVVVVSGANADLYYVQEGESYAWECVQMDVVPPGCGYYYFPPDWEISIGDDYRTISTKVGDCVIYEIVTINESIWVKYFLWQDGRRYPYSSGLHKSWVYIQPLHTNWTAWAQRYYSNPQTFDILWDNETDFAVKMRFGNKESGDIHEIHFSKVTGLLLYAHAGRFIQDEHGFYNHTMILRSKVPDQANSLSGISSHQFILALVTAGTIVIFRRKHILRRNNSSVGRMPER